MPPKKRALEEDEPSSNPIEGNLQWAPSFLGDLWSFITTSRKRKIRKIFDSKVQEEHEVPCKESSQIFSGKKEICSFCKNTLMLFQRPRDELVNLKLGPLEQIAEGPCTTNHLDLFEALDPATGPLEARKNHPYKYEVALHKETLGGVSVSFTRTDGPRPTHYSPTLHLLRDNSRLRLKPTAQKVHPSWIDPRLLRQWKDRCDRNHGSECTLNSATTSLGRKPPEWVIDVWSQRLVHGSVAEDYVALSYVWGRRAFFTTTKEDIARLQSPGALSTIAIPDTVRHALHYTEALGERYIWIDSLCIVQDDAKGKYAELENMAAIYANACVTIVAASGLDAFTGLPGLQKAAAPRTHKQTIVTIGRSSQVLLWRNPQQAEPIWNSRAWTFQEFLFSKRKIYLEGESMRWECPNASWDEQILPIDGNSQSLYFLPEQTHIGHWAMLSSKLPYPLGLARLCTNYNVRALTFPEDALNAFTGVMKVMCSSHKHGFLSGLPLAFFHIAMLWQPSTYAVRRTPRSKSSTAAYLPSWTWVGWECGLDCRLWEIACEYIRHTSHSAVPYNRIVIPSVQWSSHQGLNDKATPIPTEWADYRKKYFNTDAPPPAGWTKLLYAERINRPYTQLPDMFLAEAPPRFLYKHESDPESEFWYPVPLPSHKDEPASLICASFLSCRTKRIWAFQGDPYVGLQLWLNDSDGTRIGFFKMLESASVERDRKHRQKPLEFVEVSKGRDFCVNIGFDSGSGRLKTAFEYYHVMCIGWKDSIASRKGLGIIYKDAWEAQDGEMIDLMLG